jgi:hypothetical protein
VGTMHGEVIAMRKLRQGQGVQCQESSADFRSEDWIDNEMVGCEFEDVRHGKRLRQLLEQLSHRVGATTPWACQDWANTKAAYRFFGNERISESNILAGHFACTRERFSASRGLPALRFQSSVLSRNWRLGAAPESWIEAHAIPDGSAPRTAAWCSRARE